MACVWPSPDANAEPNTETKGRFGGQSSNGFAAKDLRLRPAGQQAGAERERLFPCQAVLADPTGRFCRKSLPAGLAKLRAIHRLVVQPHATLEMRPIRHVVFGRGLGHFQRPVQMRVAASSSSEVWKYSSTSVQKCSVPPG